MKSALIVVGALLLASGVTVAQSQTADMAELERRLQDAQSALARVEPTELQRELKELEDEVAYLRVKARRGEPITARERRDLALKLERYTSRVNTLQPAGVPAREDNDTTTTDRRAFRGIPAGTEVDVRLQRRLSSRDAKLEDRVEAITAVDLMQGDVLLVPAGSLLVGEVTAVDKATRTDRSGSIGVVFRRLTVDNRTREIRASVVEALETDGLKDEAIRVGAAAGVGAIIGGILGGVKGALAGILIGGGGVLIATEGYDVDLPAGTVLRLKFDTDVPMGV